MLGQLHGQHMGFGTVPETQRDDFEGNTRSLSLSMSFHNPLTEHQAHTESGS